MKNIKSVLVSLLSFYFIESFAQQNSNSTLRGEAKRYWDNAMIYKEEAKSFSENELVIDELEKLIAIQEYPDAYLELGKLYGRGYVSSWIERSEECFKRYAELCPENKNLAEEENNRCEAFRNIRKKRFEKKLIGKWSPNSSYGDIYYCFEINSNGTVTVSYEYSSYLERVSGWQTINFGYWPQFGKYIFNTNNIHSETFPVRFVDSDGVKIAYVYISFFFQENYENASADELICYINMKWPKAGYSKSNYAWMWNENHKVVFNKIQ